MLYMHCDSTLVGFEGISREEAKETYRAYKDKLQPNTIAHIYFTADGDFLNVQYKLVEKSFERIRRITGYLVGTTERWNNAKTAELKDRVIHITVETLE